MECEICGKPVSETNPTRAKIEGSVMVVCKECAKLGTIQKAPPKPRFQQNKKGRKNTQPKRNYRNDEPTEELIENYNTTVRNAREAKNCPERIQEKKSMKEFLLLTELNPEK